MGSGDVGRMGEGKIDTALIENFDLTSSDGFQPRSVLSSEHEFFPNYKKNQSILGMVYGKAVGTVFTSFSLSPQSSFGGSGGGQDTVFSLLILSYLVIRSSYFFHFHVLQFQFHSQNSGT